MFAVPSFFGYNTTFVSTPVATAATGVGETSFTANWNAFAGAQYYLLDVSTSSSFSSFVFQDQVVVAPTTSYVVTGLTASTTYYYRLRASTDPVPITATGGIITYSGGRTIHTFTSSGTFTVLTAPAGATVEALVVAGGGGGGVYAGGGGGAGGLLYNAAKSVAINAYTITIGSGGSGAATGQYSTPGTNGNNSIFDTLTAIGGGYGSAEGDNPNSGGSGGGGGDFGRSGGAGTAGQGNAGGNSISTSSGGAGGGGAGAVGANGTNTSFGSGAGGNGLAYSISGTSTYYAGGGGGGSNSMSAAGGLGGGGVGNHENVVQAASGAANTGGGGGGRWVYQTNQANGGSGIVIISYPT
jgi:hypothetical protein